MWVYMQTERHEFGGLWTVGFYKPDGTFVPESDHDSSEKAAQRVHYLNGGRDDEKKPSTNNGTRRLRVATIKRDSAGWYVEIDKKEAEIGGRKRRYNTWTGAEKAMNRELERQPYAENAR
jgi:hypothetical protein